MDINQIRNSTQQFYEKVGDKFSQTRQHWWQGFGFMDKHITGKEKMLDFGCGNGRLIEYLKNIKKLKENELEKNYHGVDISKKLVAHAKNKYPNNNFATIAKENELTFKDSSFDIVFSIAVFHHFNPAMTVECLKEIIRVLKPEGKLIISVWYLWNKKYLSFKDTRQPNETLEGFIPFNSPVGIFDRYCYWWTKETLAETVKKAGFEIIEEDYTKDKQDKKRNIVLVAKKAS